MSDLPIIVLAFANEQEGRRYLRDLPEELRLLQGILSEAESHGLCRLELLPNATLDQIFDAFTRNLDRVTILHYAGHADSGRLLLESSSAGGAPAHAAGLATFLGQRRGLQLVFLNGCSTRAQAAALLEAGVASVITTARAIEDGVAREFAAAFYTELAAGLPLRAAYEASRGRVLAAKGDAPKSYYQSRNLGCSATDADSPDPTDDRGFPWEFRPGTELVERWSLPDAAGNPEFGLPHLPERDLPESPFRHLSWFTAEHAEVFFGRGYQVREVYEQVTDSSGPPILLLYGASGVGKSSLLDAGLVPRLEAGGSAVRYRRRDPQGGLSGSLQDALQPDGKRTALGETWRSEEARLGRPLVVFLDQVEEVFTRHNPAQPHELDEFLTGLVAALGNRENRPHGKLVLSFRKEWLAELDRRLAEAKLPRSKMFLKPLDRRGIIEAIRGPARPGRLQRQYRLAIEDGLPEVIAVNLLADAGSALAPTLQVLLTKMWERARTANPDQPRFDRETYESLKSEGYLLTDVLDEGLKAIGRWNPAHGRSGLALDVLNFHTTDLGTASQRTRADLDQRYAHEAGVLDGLLACCKDHYLILEVESVPDSPTRSTRLAHDLLAPLVQQRFRLSVASGQRARRLLENRAADWQDGQAGPVLDSIDLATVEEGASGMRVWTANERRLVEASQRAAEREQAAEQERARRLHEAEERQRQAEAERQSATEQRLRDQEAANTRLRRRAYALMATLAAAILVAVLALREWFEAVRETKIANAETKIAIAETAEAEKETRLAERNIRIANAGRLAACSRDAFPERPQQSLILAVEAIRATRDYGEPVVVAAQQALQDSLSGSHGRALTGYSGEVSALTLAPDGRPVTGSTDGSAWVFDLNSGIGRSLTPQAKEDQVDALAFTPDGRLVTGGASGTARVWDLKKPDAGPIVLRGHEKAIYKLAFAPDGRLVTAGEDGIPRVWDLRNPASPALVLKGQKGSIRSLAFAPDGRLVTAGIDAAVRVWDLARPSTPSLVLPGHRGWVSVAFAPDGRLVTGGSTDVTARVWDLKSPSTQFLLNGPRNGIATLAFAPDGRLVMGGNDGTARVWDLKHTSAQPLILSGHEHAVSTLGFALDGRLITGGQDGTVRVWDLKDTSAQPLILRGHDKALRAVTFSPDGQLVTASHDGTARVWDLRYPSSQPVVLHGDQHAVTALGFAADGRLVTGGIDGTARVWDLKDSRVPPIVFSVQGGRVTGLALAADGRLATADSDGTARVWDLRNPSAQPLVLRGHVGFIAAMHFAADGRLVTGGADGTARVWNLKDTAASPVVLRGQRHGISALGFARDGRLVTGDGDGIVRVWDLSSASAAPLVLHGHQRWITALAFAADGRLVTASFDDTARVWDLKNPGVPPIVLEGHEGGIVRLAFAADGRLATGGFDGTARIWDVNDPAVAPIVLRGQGLMVIALAFAADGRLATGARMARCGSGT
jgi:WD40 repeat protein